MPDPFGKCFNFLFSIFFIFISVIKGYRATFSDFSFLN
jgi:hypothetical protein